MINANALRSPDARRTQAVARNQFSVSIIDEFHTMPTALHLNAASGLTGQPVFSYGMMDFVVSHHMLYQRFNDASMVRRLAKPEIRFGYELIVGADMPEGAAFQVASRHIWQRYGHPQFRDQPHLAMPFAEYVRTIYDVVSKPMPPRIQAPVPGYEDHGVFVDFEMNGTPVGGMVSPLGVLGFGDALWNFEFWNNIRDANGMVYWGEKLGSSNAVHGTGEAPLIRQKQPPFSRPPVRPPAFSMAFRKKQLPTAIAPAGTPRERSAADPGPGNQSGHRPGQRPLPWEML